jgi:hypothetical protein
MDTKKRKYSGKTTAQKLEVIRGVDRQDNRYSFFSPSTNVKHEHKEEKILRKDNCSKTTCD